MDQNYGGSFANLIRELQQEKSPLTALDVVLKVVEVFPSFRDITTYGGRECQSYGPSLPLPSSNAPTFSVFPQKGSNLGSGNMGRILSLPIILQSVTPPHIPRWRHPSTDYVRRLPGPANPPPPKNPHILTLPPHPPRIRTPHRARVQGGGEHPGCEHRCSRTSPR